MDCLLVKELFCTSHSSSAVKADGSVLTDGACLAMFQ